jgi:hypothetical protein
MILVQLVVCCKRINIKLINKRTNTLLQIVEHHKIQLELIDRMEPIHKMGPMEQIHKMGPMEQIHKMGPMEQIHKMGLMEQIGTKGPMEQIGTKGPMEQIGTKGPMEQIGTKGPMGQIGTKGPMGQRHDHQHHKKALELAVGIVLLELVADRMGRQGPPGKIGSLGLQHVRHHKMPSGSGGTDEPELIEMTAALKEHDRYLMIHNHCHEKPLEPVDAVEVQQEPVDAAGVRQEREREYGHELEHFQLILLHNLLMKLLDFRHTRRFLLLREKEQVLELERDVAVQEVHTPS